MIETKLCVWQVGLLKNRELITPEKICPNCSDELYKYCVFYRPHIDIRQVLIRRQEKE